MNVFGSFYCWLCRSACYLQSPLLLLIRLIWGILFVQAGWGKLMNANDVASFFANLGIPMPLFNAYFVGSIEFFGGFLLIIGFLSRFAALPLAATMLTAYMTAHKKFVNGLGSGIASLNFSSFTKSLNLFMREAPFTFLLASLIILAFGAGYFSIDHWWKRSSNH